MGQHKGNIPNINRPNRINKQDTQITDRGRDFRFKVP